MLTLDEYGTLPWVVSSPGMGCVWTGMGPVAPPRLGRQEDYRFHHGGGTEHGRIDSGWFWSTPSHQSCVLNYANMGRKHPLVHITVSSVCPSLFSGKGTSSLWQGSWLDAIDVSAWSCWWFQFPCVPSFDRGWPGLILCKLRWFEVASHHRVVSNIEYISHTQIERERYAYIYIYTYVYTHIYT